MLRLGSLVFCDEFEHGVLNLEVLTLQLFQELHVHPPVVSLTLA